MSIIVDINTFLMNNGIFLAATIAAVVLTIFGDTIIKKVLVKRIKKVNVFWRTTAFVLFAIIVLPLLIWAIQWVVLNMIFKPLSNYIIIVLIVLFGLIGFWMNKEYKMK
ncbi:hypothetical protein ACFL1H_04070 [Nanoarchaeota archaeon]